MKKNLICIIIVCIVMISAFSAVLLMGDRTDDNIVLSGSEEQKVSNKLVEHNLAAVENSLSIPLSAVAQYVAADGDEQKVRETLTEIQVLSDEICRGIDSSYDKLCAISRWISESIYYDYDAFNEFVTQETIDLRNVLSTRRTVCMGYANLCAALCAAQGIDCRVVHGAALPSGRFGDDGEGGEQHEWNIAVLDGRTVWIDALWDTTNYYIIGEYHDGRVKDKYFDMSDEDIAKNHRADRVEIRDYFSLLD